MSKTKTLIILGLLAGAGVWAWSYFKGLGTFANNLIVRPMLGPTNKAKIELTSLSYPINIEFGNRSDVSLTIQVMAIDILYDNKTLAQSMPAVNTVTLAPNTSGRIDNIMIRIPHTSLISVVGDTVKSLIDNFNISAIAPILAKTKARVSVKVNNTLQAAMVYDMASGDTTISGLGLTASSQRKIGKLEDYKHLIPLQNELSYTDPLYSKDTTPEETARFMRKMVKDCKGDTATLARALYDTSLTRTLQNIFDFVYRYIEYVPDSTLFEQVRRPLRTLYDQKGDCDCYSTLIGSMLENLNIPYKFRIAAYNGRNYYQHIYVVVPTEKYGELVIDPVLEQCFYEKPTSKHKDF